MDEIEHNGTVAMGTEQPSDLLREAMERVQVSMDEILTNFKPGAKITVLVRTPAKPEADFCLTNDSPDEVLVMARRRLFAPASGSGPAYLDFITPDEIFDQGPEAVRNWQAAKAAQLHLCTPPPTSHVELSERRFCDFPKCDCSSGAFERCSHPPRPKVECPGADDPEERCPRHPSECRCWEVDNDHPMRKSAPPAVGLGVKLLEWTECSSPKGCWVAVSVCGDYVIRPRSDGEVRLALPETSGWKRYPTADGAKAAAQIAYERRVLSAFATPPPATELRVTNPTTIAQFVGALSDHSVTLPLQVTDDDVGTLVDADGKPVLVVDVDRERPDEDVAWIVGMIQVAVNTCGGFKAQIVAAKEGSKP